MIKAMKALDWLFVDTGSESREKYQVVKAALEENKALKATLADKEVLLDRKRLWEILDDLHRDLNFCYNSEQTNKIYNKAIAAIRGEGNAKNSKAV